MRENEELYENLGTKSADINNAFEGLPSIFTIKTNEYSPNSINIDDNTILWKRCINYAGPCDDTLLSDINNENCEPSIAFEYGSALYNS